MDWTDLFSNCTDCTDFFWKCKDFCTDLFKKVLATLYFEQASLIVVCACSVQIPVYFFYLCLNIIHWKLLNCFHYALIILRVSPDHCGHSTSNQIINLGIIQHFHFFNLCWWGGGYKQLWKNETPTGKLCNSTFTNHKIYFPKYDLFLVKILKQAPNYVKVC